MQTQAPSIFSEVPFSGKCIFVFVQRANLNEKHLGKWFAFDDSENFEKLAFENTRDAISYSVFYSEHYCENEHGKHLQNENIFQIWISKTCKTNTMCFQWQRDKYCFQQFSLAATANLREIINYHFRQKTQLDICSVIFGLNIEKRTTYKAIQFTFIVTLKIHPKHTQLNPWLSWLSSWIPNIPNELYYCARSYNETINSNKYIVITFCLQKTLIMH